VRAPFQGVALFAAGYYQHIEIAQEALFKIGISAVDHFGQYQFDDEDASVRRQRGSAVAENLRRRIISVAMKHMFQHMNVRPRRNLFGQIGRDKLNTIRKRPRRKAPLSRIDRGWMIDKHAAHLGERLENGFDHRAAATAKIGYHARVGKIPSPSDRAGKIPQAKFP
jgi:hypothetical protein